MNASLNKCFHWSKINITFSSSITPDFCVYFIWNMTSVTKFLGDWPTWTLLLTCSLIFGQICQWISLIMTSKVPASLFSIPCSEIKPPWKGNQSIPLDYCVQHAIHAAFDLVIIWVRLVREEIGPLTAKWSANGPLFQLGGLLTTRTLFLFCSLLWSLWNHRDSLNMFFGTTNNKQFLSGYCKLSKKKKNALNSNRDAHLKTSLASLGSFFTPSKP